MTDHSILIRQWQEPTPQPISEALIAACDGDPLLATILARRGFSDPNRIHAFFSADAYTPAPPEQLTDLVAASDLLRAAITANRRILVWGDFDVDGQTATALFVDGLRRLRADVVYYVPNRASESHGIRMDRLEALINEHQPSLLLTCDTGITEFESIARARSLGLTVIITDHHDLGERLPDANAVVNPKRLPADHPLVSLPGVGVAYKLMQHVYVALGRERELAHLLDLVALGIVADVATQTADTRYLLQIGLDHLRRTGRIGLQALIDVAKLPVDKLTADQIGFQLGPRLNAIGRLGDAMLAVELLLTHDRARAAIIARQLEGYNNERRNQTHEIELAALEMIKAEPSLLNFSVLVLYQPHWHPGLVGIVANRLAERYQRPVILLTGGQNESSGKPGSEIAQGSARSIDGIDISHAIAAHRDLLHRFGGHPGAAGLSLDVAKIAMFRQRLSRTVDALVPSVPTLTIDAVVGLDELTFDLASRLQRLAPFGAGNPPITLATMNVSLSGATFIGREQLHRKLTVEDQHGQPQSLLWWGSAADKLPAGRFDVAYRLTINDRRELEAMLIDYREREAPIDTQAVSSLHIEDWRGDSTPLARLETLLATADADCIVWAEAYSRQQYPTWKRRAELTPAPILIIYTAPPDEATLRAAIQIVQPTTLHLFAVESPLNNSEAFLKQLATAARNALDRLDGVITLDVLCGATAGSRTVVRAGLDVLSAQGLFRWSEQSTGMIQLAAEVTTPDPNVERFQQRFQIAYAEMEAYRRFYRKMATAQIVNNGYQK